MIKPDREFLLRCIVTDYQMALSVCDPIEYMKRHKELLYSICNIFEAELDEIYNKNVVKPDSSVESPSSS
jgi:hypothetical protein